jgi:hypothetical protein
MFKEKFANNIQAGGQLRLGMSTGFFCAFPKTYIAVAMPSFLKSTST